MPRRPKTNRERARYAVERFGKRPHEMVEDIMTLLEQVYTIEHVQDRTAIKTIADRYGFKMENIGMTDPHTPRAGESAPVAWRHRTVNGLGWAYLTEQHQGIDMSERWEPLYAAPPSPAPSAVAAAPSPAPSAVAAAPLDAMAERLAEAVRAVDECLHDCAQWDPECPHARRARDRITTLADVPAGDGWLPIAEARKDRTPYLMKLKDSIPFDRPDLRRWDGLVFVGRHPGLADDGFDIGWQFAAPVGQGGFPDEWFEGFRDLPPAVRPVQGGE